MVVEHDPRPSFFEGLKVAAEKTVCRTGIRPRAQVRDAITYAEAAARLGTNHNGLKGLVQASFISVEKDAGNNERICEQSLKYFEDRYVKAAAYASILDCPPTYALKQLRAEGVLPINDWKAAGPRFVDWQEVKRLVGLERPETPDLARWESLQQTLAEHLAIHAVPATTRVTAGPAIEVRSTSGRWSFLVEESKYCGGYSLISHFTARRQPGRWRRVCEASIAPSDIWPGATVYRSDRGGFSIIDNAFEYMAETSDKTPLIARAIDRAHEIHRLF